MCLFANVMRAIDMHLVKGNLLTYLLIAELYWATECKARYGTKLHCLLTGATWCEQFAQNHYVSK